MSVATLADLFSYEQAIEDGVKTLLENEDLTCFTEFTDATKETPFVEIQLQAVQPTGHQHHIEDTLLYDAWDGQMVFRIVTRRGENSDQHRTMLATIRVIAQRMLPLFTTTISPYHAIGLFQEQQMTRGVQAELYLDWTELRYKIRFNIRTPTWPPMGLLS